MRRITSSSFLQILAKYRKILPFSKKWLLQKHFPKLVNSMKEKEPRRTKYQLYTDLHTTYPPFMFLDTGLSSCMIEVNETNSNNIKSAEACSWFIERGRERYIPANDLWFHVTNPMMLKGMYYLFGTVPWLMNFTARKLVREPVEQFSRLVFRRPLVDNTATCKKTIHNQPKALCEPKPSMPHLLSITSTRYIYHSRMMVWTFTRTSSVSLLCKKILHHGIPNAPVQVLLSFH